MQTLDRMVLYNSNRHQTIRTVRMKTRMSVLVRTDLEKMYARLHGAQRVFFPATNEGTRGCIRLALWLRPTVVIAWTPGVAVLYS